MYKRIHNNQIVDHFYKEELSIAARTRMVNGILERQYQELSSIPWSHKLFWSNTLKDRIISSFTTTNYVFRYFPNPEETPFAVLAKMERYNNRLARLANNFFNYASVYADELAEIPQMDFNFILQVARLCDERNIPYFVSKKLSVYLVATKLTNI